LRLFRALPKERFAAISVDASVARHAMEAVVLDLRFLAALGLCPVVVVGLFENAEAMEHAARIRRRLEREGVASAVMAPDRADLFAEVAAAAQAGTLPIVAFGRDEAGPFPTTEQRIERLGALLAALATRKLIFLDRRGGLALGGGARIEVVNLAAD